MKPAKTSAHAPAHGRVPASYPPKGHREFNLHVYHEGLPDQSHNEFIAHTSGMTSPERWADWCQAMFYAGVALYQWNEVPELRSALLSACSLEQGMDVLLVGKYAEESGLASALESLLGDSGTYTVQDIGGRIIEAIRAGSPSASTRLQWEFDYLDSVPDQSLDRIILFGAASHVADWDRSAAQVERVLRQGGRVVIAEAPLGGKEFMEALHEDSHYESFTLRALDGLGPSEEDLPDTGPKESEAPFSSRLTWTWRFSHEDLCHFYGQKGPLAGRHMAAGDPESTTPGLVAAFPTTTPEVQAFLVVKPAESTLDELQARVGETGEMANVTITNSPRSYDHKGWQEKRRMCSLQYKGWILFWGYQATEKGPDR